MGIGLTNPDGGTQFTNKNSTVHQTVPHEAELLAKARARLRQMQIDAYYRRANRDYPDVVIPDIVKELFPYGRAKVDREWLYEEAVWHTIIRRAVWRSGSGITSRQQVFEWWQTEPFAKFVEGLDDLTQ